MRFDAPGAGSGAHYLLLAALYDVGRHRRVCPQLERRLRLYLADHAPGGVEPWDALCASGAAPADLDVYLRQVLGLERPTPVLARGLRLAVSALAPRPLRVSPWSGLRVWRPALWFRLRALPSRAVAGSPPGLTTQSD